MDDKVDDMQNDRMDRIEAEVKENRKDLQDHLIECAKAHRKSFWALVIGIIVIALIVGPDTSTGQFIIKFLPFV